LWDNGKSAYIYGFTVTKDVKDITKNIPQRYVADDVVSLL